MKNITRTQYQAFPYHLVEPSPWPILTSFALLTLTTSAVMYFHGFANGGELLTLGFCLTAGGMILWFRDVIVEGTKFKYNNISKFMKVSFNLIVTYFIKMPINILFNYVKFYSTKIDITATSQYDNNIKLNPNQLNNTMFSTFSSQFKLNPWFVSGFSDAECSFLIIIRRGLSYKLGWSTTGKFRIELHKKDLELLKSIQVFFNGIGQVGIISTRNLAYFEVTK